MPKYIKSPAFPGRCFAGEDGNPFRLMPIRPAFVWASAAQNIDSVELDKIAEALGAEFVCAFKFPNGDKV